MNYASSFPPLIVQRLERSDKSIRTDTPDACQEQDNEGMDVCGTEKDTQTAQHIDLELRQQVYSTIHLKFHY